MSRSVENTCVVCGRELADPSRSRYCSNACRQRAYRMRLAAAARAGAAPGTVPDAGSTLPAPVDSFVGRRRDVDRLLYLIGRHRMVTLVGTAGVGKTRLAVELANRLPGRRSRQLALVELDVLDGGELLPQTIAAAFGLREQPGRPITETVFAALRGESILLLDNCEHLIEPCAEFAGLALRRCPGLRVLATSREALDIPGEVVYPVNGLSLPGPGLDRMTLLRSDAVRLFADRARQYRHDFEITTDNGEHVAQVCAQLEGSPLAIELAARWVPLLPVSTIRARLAKRFELLTGSRRTVRGRQRSLWAAIDWSYQLLNPSEQLVLRRLSVFSGPFDLETATAVCADPDLAVERVFDLVFRLHAKSLVAQTAEATRFRLPESVRLYARQRLDASGDASAAMTRLVDWLTVLAEPLIDEPVWFSREVQERLDRMSDNLVAATRWTEASDDPRHVVLTIALIRCWMPRGHFTEARKLLRAALDRVDSDPGHRCLLLSYGGYLAAMQGDVHEALGLPAEALELARAIGDRVQVVAATYTLGAILAPAGQVDRAIVHLTECLALAREIGDPAAVAMALERLAWARLQQGDVDTAHTLLTEALPAFLRAPQPHGLSLAMHTAGRIALGRDRLDEAEDHFREALRTAITSWLEVPFALEGLAMAAGRRGDVARAVRLSRAALTIRGGDRLHAEPQWRRTIGDYAARWGALTGEEIDRIAEQVAGRSKDELLTYALRDVWSDVENLPAPVLDDGERQIVVLVTEGLANRQIADRLGVSVRTVAYRLRRIRDELGLSSREDIPAWAQEHLGSG